MIEIKEVLTKKQERDFFRFPHVLYKGDKVCAPSFIDEEKNEFNPRINGAFEFCIARKFVAYQDGKPVGRIAGIFNQKYNDKLGVKQIRFTRFDALDNQAVADALMDKLVEWGRFLGMNEIIGPIGFSDFDKQGMLVDGFDELDLYITPYNFPYYPRLVEKMGFVKAVDWVEYEIKVPDEVPSRLLQLSEMAAQRYGYSLLPITSFKNIEPYIMEALFEIMNEAFEPLFGVAPINMRQARRQADMLKMIFNKDYVYAVMKDGRLIGYGFMAPNITRAVQLCNGRLTLRGLIKLIRTMKKHDRIDLYSIAVRKEFQSRGVNAIIMAEGLRAVAKNKVKYIYTGPELEDNTKVRSQWDGLDNRQYRRRRCYTRSI